MAIKNETKYFVPMSTGTFNEIKNEAIKIWEEYDDTYNYSSSKINIVNSITNIQDNGLVIFFMFDMYNRVKLLSRISDKAKNEIFDNRLDVKEYEVLINAIKTYEELTR